jgi:hypothetical protein
MEVTGLKYICGWRFAYTYLFAYSRLSLRMRIIYCHLPALSYVTYGYSI